MRAKAILAGMRGRLISISDRIKNSPLNKEKNKKEKFSVTEAKAEVKHLEYAIALVQKMDGREDEPGVFVRRISGNSWEDEPLDIGMGIVFKLDERRVFEIKWGPDHTLEVRSMEGSLAIIPSSSNQFYIDIDKAG